MYIVLIFIIRWLIYSRTYYFFIGELYARAFLRNGEPHPVETVIDSSRYVRISITLDVHAFARFYIAFNFDTTH